MPTYYTDKALGEIAPEVDAHWQPTEDVVHSDIIFVAKQHTPSWLKQHMREYPQKPVVPLSPSPSAHTLKHAFQDAAAWLSRIQMLPKHSLQRIQQHPFLSVAMYAWMREGALKIKLDMGFPTGYAWGLEGYVPALRHVLEAMVEAGWLRAEVFDVGYTCPHCDSLALMTRDVCPTCQSGDVTFYAVMHHFACAYQGSERHFTYCPSQGLQCPKCLKYVQNFGTDYDKPGESVYCRACDVDHVHAQIGVRCLSCHQTVAHTKTHRKVLKNYILTSFGESQLLSGTVNPRETGTANGVSYLQWRQMMRWMADVDALSAQVAHIKVSGAHRAGIYMSLIGALNAQLPKRFVHTSQSARHESYVCVPLLEDVPILTSTLADITKHLRTPSDVSIDWETLEAHIEKLEREELGVEF